MLTPITLSTCKGTTLLTFAGHPCPQSEASIGYKTLLSVIGYKTLISVQYHRHNAASFRFSGRPRAAGYNPSGTPSSKRDPGASRAPSLLLAH
eukprot:1196251-Prorocentrum_minimum.AAC.3